MHVLAQGPSAWLHTGHWASQKTAGARALLPEILIYFIWVGPRYQGGLKLPK